MVAYPQGKQMFPQLLRQAGYYCTNNAKEDYNLAKPGKVWDESSKKAHWKNRAAGQPFFAVFNCEKSHESKLRIRPHEQIHDPAKVRVPAYHPDTPEVRQDWAQYYDTRDRSRCRRRAVGSSELGASRTGRRHDRLLFRRSRLRHAGQQALAARSRACTCRWWFISRRNFESLRAPDYQPGGAIGPAGELCRFRADACSAWPASSRPIGCRATPSWANTQRRRSRLCSAFAAGWTSATTWCAAVTDGRYVYIRNFRPDKIYGQHLDYMWQTPTTRVWERLS